MKTQTLVTITDTNIIPKTLKLKIQKYNKLKYFKKLTEIKPEFLENFGV